MKPLIKIPKGTTVLFSSGEYSDYLISALMQAKVDIDPSEVRNEYINLYPEETVEYGFKESNFLNFLKEKNLFEEVSNPKWMEWHLSEYSCISEMQVYEGPILFN
jgi:hypothetical protein